MVALMCAEAVILGTNSKDYQIYSLGDRIFCCAPSTGIERGIMLEISNQVECQYRERGIKPTMDQVRDMLARKYENVSSENVLLVGQDRHGPHIYAMKGIGIPQTLIYAAKGKGRDDIIGYLMHNWKKSLNLAQAEQLVRTCLLVGENDYVNMCVIYKEKETWAKAVPQLEPVAIMAYDTESAFDDMTSMGSNLSN
ncbi:uncharacterized protein LOC108112260 [Drosophila eugracilis]|uniref:uncharacterized protein LOC108112260 n=1 Tax=Drosophila eugracilis TaxID=29029 RepID=UPI001BDA2774|nr:uncharacterized protein LOC108112260 [Drosophila eugracilis]